MLGGLWLWGYENEQTVSALTAFAAIPVANLRKVTVSWTAPGGSDSVLVVRKIGSAPTTTSDGTVVYSSTGSSVTDANLDDGAAHYYAGFNELGGEYSSPSIALAIPSGDRITLYSSRSRKR